MLQRVYNYLGRVKSGFSDSTQVNQYSRLTEIRRQSNCMVYEDSVHAGVRRGSELDYCNRLLYGPWQTSCRCKKDISCRPHVQMSLLSYLGRVQYHGVIDFKWSRYNWGNHTDYQKSPVLSQVKRSRYDFVPGTFARRSVEDRHPSSRHYLPGYRTQNSVTRCQWESPIWRLQSVQHAVTLVYQRYSEIRYHYANVVQVTCHWSKNKFFLGMTLNSLGIWLLNIVTCIFVWDNCNLPSGQLHTFQEPGHIFPENCSWLCRIKLLMVVSDKFDHGSVG